MKVLCETTLCGAGRQGFTVNPHLKTGEGKKYLEALGKNLSKFLVGQ